MRYRIRPLVVFTSMIAAMSLCAAVIVRAQAPAGPNRPPQVPEEYIVTPFGYFHPSCVVHLAEGEELMKADKFKKPMERSTPFRFANIRTIRPAARCSQRGHRSSLPRSPIAGLFPVAINTGELWRDFLRTGMSHPLPSLMTTRWFISFPG